MIAVVWRGPRSPPARGLHGGGTPISLLRPFAGPARPGPVVLLWCGPMRVLVLRFDRGVGPSGGRLVDNRSAPLPCPGCCRSDPGVSDCTSIDYPEGGEAQVVETAITSSARHGNPRIRIVVRRTRLISSQAELWPNWRFHPFATNTAQPPAEADLYHRRHAKVELAIRDLKEASGLAHLPSGTSSPTPPGWPARCSPTTSTGGSTTAAATFSACPPDGPGPPNTKPPYGTSAAYPSSADPPFDTRYPPA